MGRIISVDESRTFAEYLLLPNLTRRECGPDNVDIRTPIAKFTRGENPDLFLNIPFSSAMMQSVSDHKMAISLARLGGISFIYASQSPEEQAAMIAAVKHHKAGFVVSDSNVKPNQTILEVLALVERTGHSTVAVTDDGSPTGKLLGLVTKKDYRLTRVDLETPVEEIMTKFDDLICSEDGISIEDANDLIWKSKVDCLPIVDKGQRLVQLVFRKDYEDHQRFQQELVDSKKRLVVGAAINTRDFKERVPLLVEAEADVLCIDSSDGYSEWQKDTLRFIRDEYGTEVKVGAGNVVDRDAFRYLVEAGADFVTVGIGGGAVCITREQKGIGRGQATAVMEVASERDAYFESTGAYVPVCSDGGISQDYHVVLALAMGADFIMMGRYFARFEESPSPLIKVGTAMVKEYWGEGTTRAANWQRYSEGSSSGRLPFEEGVDAYVPFAGEMGPNLESTLAKLRSVMCNCGATSLAELRESARFVLVSPPSLREGGIHDVILKSIQQD